MDRLEQLREMIAAKAKELEADRPRIEKIKARTDSAKVGDMFMLPININDEFCIFWTVVRFHPDCEKTALIVPLVDFPLLSRYDVRLLGMWDNTLVAHCGQSEWVDISYLHPSHRIEEISEKNISEIRRKLAQLARGLPCAMQEGEIDSFFDIDYEEFEEEISFARNLLYEDSKKV